MIVAILVVVAVAVFLYIAFPLINVIGASMYPTYTNGEIVFGTRLYKKSKLKKGDVIVYRSPAENDRLVIKRISNIIKDSPNEYLLYCVGDNHKASYDSRYYGYFSSKNVVCKLLNQRRKIEDVCN